MIRTLTLLALAGSLTGLLAAEGAAPRTLTLAETVQLSAATTPVAVSRLEAAIAKAGYGAERANLRPNLSVTAGASRANAWTNVGNEAQRIAPSNSFDTRLRVGQALINLEAWHRTTAADRQVALADAQTTQSLEESAAVAGAAYVTLSSAQALELVRKDELRLANELLTLAKAQVKAGVAEAIAETRAASRVEVATSDLASAVGAVRRAVIALALALDLNPADPLLAGETLGDTLAASIQPEADANAQAQRQRPELRVSAETLAYLEASQLAAQGARLPRLDGFADGGVGGPAVDSTETTWRVGVGLTIPLVDGNIYRDDQASLRVAQQRLRQIVIANRIRSEVADAQAAVNTALSRLSSDRSRSALANEELKQAQARFSAGVAGNLEVISAQQNLTQAQESVVASTESLVQSRIRLAKAIGLATSLR